jgi:hypothetical protein
MTENENKPEQSAHEENRAFFEAAAPGQSIPPMSLADNARLTQINQEIRDTMGKYKISMYGIVACIIAYVICLFVIKNATYVLILCVPMVALAIYNSRLAKKIRKLCDERDELQAPKNEDGTPIVSSAQPDKEITSYNQLSKAYTVMDNVDLGGVNADHVILSPFEAVIVIAPENAETAKEALEKILEEKQAPAPIRIIDADLPVAEGVKLAQENQKSVLSEAQIMQVLMTLVNLQ